LVAADAGVSGAGTAAVAGLEVLSSVGGGVLSGILAGAIDQLRSRNRHDAGDERPAAEQEIAREIGRVLAAEDARAQALRADIAEVLAVGDSSGNISLWDTDTGNRTATLAEGSRVTSVAFSPDGHTLAAGDLGGNVSLWNTTTRQRTATLAEGSEVASVAFSPDGNTLAAGDASGDVVLHRQSFSNLTYGFFARLICGEVRKNMTTAQWTANAPGQPYRETCPSYP
jgi:dipeptidyl aminopeptidase/acylaminoacyl peptidase